METVEIKEDKRRRQMSSKLSIRNLEDALVELLTNSDDAYMRNEVEERAIKIIVNSYRGHEDWSGKIDVIDHAGGMTESEVRERLIPYGGFAAGESSRGFMGRGAKDVASLGLAVFQSIKNDKYTIVRIPHTLDKAEISSREATKSDYDILDIEGVSKDGTRVTIFANKDVTINQVSTLDDRLSCNPELRLTLQRSKVIATDDAEREKRYISYQEPSGKVVFNETKSFEDPFTDAVAHLTVKLAEEQINPDRKEGILVHDKYAAHEVTRFSSDRDSDPIGARIFGTLQCNYIRQLQIEYEKYRDKKEKPSHNPHDIVEPDRRKGLVSDHPFVENLYNWADEQLENIIQNLADRERKQDVITDQEVKDKINNLCDAAVDYLKDRLEEIESDVSSDNEEEDVLVRLNPKFNNLELGESRKLLYSCQKDKYLESNPNIDISVEGGGIEVEQDALSLRQHRKEEDWLAGKFEITAVELSDANLLTVSNPSQRLPDVDRLISVIAPQETELDHGFYTKSNNYSCKVDATRSIKFIAKGSEFNPNQWSLSEVSVAKFSEDYEVIGSPRGSMIDNSPPTWEGVIRIKGIRESSPSLLKLSTEVGSTTHTDECSVRIIRPEEDPDEPEVKIEFKEKASKLSRAMWSRTDANTIIVFAKDETISRYLGSADKNYPGQNTVKFMILLAEIVSERIAWRVISKEIDEHPARFDDFNSLVSKYHSEIQAFLPVAHNLLVPDVDID